MMSTLEKLFVQIFDRKKWIIDQLNQQKDLYDQYLASTLLIDGIQPPSWLWNTGSEATSSELKKEDMISGLLFPPPRSHVPSYIGCNNFYNRSVSAANSGMISDNVFSETCASNKYCNVAERSTVIPNCHQNSGNVEIHSTLNVVPELDHTITSPQRQTDSMVPETCFEPMQSLARIQRSRSRQKALELRNSATEKSKKRPRNESCMTVYAGRITRSRTSSEPHHHVKELVEPDKASLSFNGVLCDRAMSSRANKKINSVNENVDLCTAFDTQVTSESSSLVHKEIQLSDIVDRNTENRQTERDIMIHNCGITVSSPTTQPEINYADGLLVLGNSSKVPNGRVECSRSASMDKSLESENQFNLMKQSGSELLVHGERDASGVAGAKLVSDAPADHNQICSRSKQGTATMASNMKPLVSRPLSNGSIFVEPKHLTFDDEAECGMNESVQLSLDKKIEVPDQSQKKRLTYLDTTELTKDILHEKEVTAVGYLVRDEIGKMTGEEEKCWGSLANGETIENVGRETSKCEIGLTTGGDSSSLSSPLSSKGPSNEITVADISPESNKIPVELSTEALKRITMSNSSHEKCSCSSRDCLLKKDHVKEMVDAEEELITYSGTCRKEKLEYFNMDKAETDMLHSVPSTHKASSLSAMSSREGLYQTSQVDLNISPVSKRLSNQALVESEKKVVDSHIHEIRSSAANVEQQESGGEEDQKLSPCIFHGHGKLESLDTEEVGYHILPASCIARTSNVSRTSSRKRTCNIDEHVAVDTSPESDKIIKQSDVSSDRVTSRKNSSGKKCNGEFLLVTKTTDNSKLDTCDGLGESSTPVKMYEEPEIVSCHDLLRPSDDKTALRQIVTHGVSQIHSEGQTNHLVDPITHEENLGCAKSIESSPTKYLIEPGKATSNALNKSWPQNKRRKIDSESSLGFITATRVRKVKPNPGEDEILGSLKNAEVGSETENFQQSPENFQQSANEYSVAVISQSSKHLTVESSRYSLGLLINEAELEKEPVNVDASIPLGVEETQLESSLGSSRKKPEESQSFLQDEHTFIDPCSAAFDVEIPFESQDTKRSMCDGSETNIGCAEQIVCTKRDMQERKSISGDKLFSHHEDLDHIGADQSMPEFEGFNISARTDNILSCIGAGTISFDESGLPSSTMERISVLEQLCRSSSMGTPLPHPLEYKSHVKLSTLPTYNPIDEEINHYSPERSYSVCMSSSSGQSDSDAWSPYTPQVEKLYDNIISLSADQCSRKQQSTNPELTPIHEDSGSSREENENLGDMGDQSQGPRATGKSSTCREPLADISNSKPPQMVSEAEKIHERDGPANFSSNGMKSHGSQIGTKKKSRFKDKENHGPSIGENSLWRSIKSLQNRCSKPKLSRNKSEKGGSDSYVEKGSKGTNIVSNIKSFIPFVQAKHQQAAVPTGRKDVKVKALEVAAAARRQAEEKEKKLEMKREAVKLERARREEEKARELELQKKKKEEAKKKEADMAERKRIRVEEEMKEKQRKKMRKIQHKKLDTEKGRRNRLPDEEIKQQNLETVNDREDCANKRVTRSTSTAKASASYTKKASNVYEGCEALNVSHDVEKVVSDLSTANEKVVSVTGGAQEQSYDISPYQSSDDEEDERVTTKKVNPSWARDLGPLLRSMEEIDPFTIFSASSFCSIAEVLPRKNSK